MTLSPPKVALSVDVNEEPLVQFLDKVSYSSDPQGNLLSKQTCPTVTPASRVPLLQIKTSYEAITSRAALAFTRYGTTDQVALPRINCGSIALFVVGLVLEDYVGKCTLITTTGDLGVVTDTPELDNNRYMNASIAMALHSCGMRDFDIREIVCSEPALEYYFTALLPGHATILNILFTTGMNHSIVLYKYLAPGGDPQLVIFDGQVEKDPIPLHVYTHRNSTIIAKDRTRVYSGPTPDRDVCVSTLLPTQWIEFHNQVERIMQLPVEQQPCDAKSTRVIEEYKRQSAYRSHNSFSPTNLTPIGPSPLQTMSVRPTAVNIASLSTFDSSSQNSPRGLLTTNRDARLSRMRRPTYSRTASRWQTPRSASTPTSFGGRRTRTRHRRRRTPRRRSRMTRRR